MEVELEPRVKPLGYKVKAMSRESPAQKAAHLLDTDLRNHWSTATNTKEWILLELDEPCLLSHIRIYNKSVLEWEISVGLRYKPETFVKVRPRCEAPRRDMMYPMNYTPCRFVRISCMRGNPIALFFVQLIGISVPGLEAEFHPVANYLLPYIISHKQDAVDMHLQLLQDVTSRLARFLPHLEADLNSFAEAAEPTMRFLAMLAGPFYPILQIASERENARLAPNIPDYEASKINVSSTALTVSSNFEPRRSRTTSSVSLPISMHLVFRPDAVLLLLRKAYKDPNLGSVCRTASRILLKFMEPVLMHEVSGLASEITSSVPDETSKSDHRDPISLPDYSNLLGEEFQIPCDSWDLTYLNVLDSAAVEEGLVHVLYASASQPLHCSKLAENTSDLWLALPLIQALLPALRPNSSSPYQIDDKFSLWKQPFVQNALSQIVATSSSAIYCPLLRACAGYLASFSPSHAKAACVLIDLCCGVLAPWTAQVIAKVDLTIELLEDLLGAIQGAHVSFSRARAALKYIVLMLSGNMDDLMAKYKEAKFQLLFLVEMLEPYLEPSLTPLKGMIAFGNVSSIFTENQEKNCATAINVIRTAVRKSAVLPSLEAEWRRGSVAPSVLLSVLDPQMQLPPDIDNRKFPSPGRVEPQSLASLPLSSRHGVISSRSNSQETTDAKVDITDTIGRVDVLEDANLLFAPPDLNRMSLVHVPSSTDKKISDSNHLNVSLEVKNASSKNSVNQFPTDAALDADQGIEFNNLLADYSQLTNYRDCELRASEFRRLALNLISQNKLTQESHDVAIDALLLAAECYINPYFMIYLKDNSSYVSKIYPKNSNNHGPTDMERIFGRKDNDLKLVADIERRRDRVVLEILIEAAGLDRKYREVASEGEILGLPVEGGDDVNLFQQDNLSADAITLVRQNQALLCNFLIHHLQRDSHQEQHPRHEILMWCLLFLLHSATKLFCAPEHVVDVILKFAESFNMHLKSFCCQSKEGNPQLNHFKLHEVQRCWILLQNLVIASSGNDERSVLPVNVRNGFRFSNLIPNLVWLQKVPAFSSSPFPIVRYFGWMAIARNAKQFLDERLFLVSDLPELTYLLSIFSDDLSVVDNIVDQKNVDKRIEQLSIHPDIKCEDGSKNLGCEDRWQSFHVLYPVISKFFPSFKEDFIGFGETILEAVGLQMKFLSTYMVPDLMCWFSDLCLSPFVQSKNTLALSQDKPDHYKGFVAKNAKAVILYILEAIVVEHMEAMVPEIPRVVQVFVSLCRTSYCDVSFLDSILHLLKPIIAYSLSKVPAEEDSLVDDSCENFESLCFSELFRNIKSADTNLDTPVEKGKCQALTIYVLASVFGNLSFQRKTEFLQSALLWADFASSDGTNSLPDYICAYQALMENCRDLLIATSKVWGIIPLNVSPDSDTSISSVDGFSEFSSWFLNDICNSPSPAEVSGNHQDDSKSVADVNQNVCQLTLEEVKTLLEELEAIISKLSPTLEQCWRLHHKLSKKLTLTCAECLLYSRCLWFITDRVSASSGVEDIHPSKLSDDVQDIWRTSLEGLSKMILLLQDKHCWEVASLLIDSLLGVPQHFCLDNVISDICFAIKNFANSAPNISCRILTDKLIQLLLARGIHKICQNEGPLVDLFCAMLVHPEPEQRYIALKHLGRLVGQDVDGGRLILSSTTESIIATSDLPTSANEQILCALVTATWDNVALMASSDTSLLLRTNATSLLVNFLPFAERSKLQSFLASADNILQCLTSLSQPTRYGPLTQFSLALMASVFLYCPSEDISLIPESIWRSIETLGMSKIDRYCTSLEKKACEALCRLKSDGEQAKQVLREVLSSSPPKQHLPDFLTIRESILTVIGNLTSAKSYLDFFSEEAEQKLMELEETEIEMEFLQKEHPLPDSSTKFKDWRQLPFMSAYSKDDLRLQQIKEGIKSIEKAKLREEIVARRQQKLLLRRARQQFLEEAALREAELIQKIDRERADEVEKELERQKLLELERAKTRELRNNLEMEKEKQAQRDLQRELEQVESGVRPSRREFSSSGHTGARDRYRERETSREGSEGSIRTSSRGADGVASTTAAALPGRGSFSGQLPTILQSRERTDECGSSYEENMDGSKDSGDTGSVGDPDMEGQPISFGSGQRHGSRGSKSRQIIERRERDGRREGKWERKH
ncbi:uncharacterized protein LOC131015933 isoform X2 [Salvia miltiorrhiza]|uniref:uncharacterized protein LOC131015933 isoform X2 n=1 Tax=Salvia miltiorrhiza TaxID=226208 RepID=UPI0025AD8BB9|nr:uncharacterized protein LOC131015933 isoform X2 [Salvia miltiorrhiza]